MSIPALSALNALHYAQTADPLAARNQQADDDLAAALDLEADTAEKKYHKVEALLEVVVEFATLNRYSDAKLAYLEIQSLIDSFEPSPDHPEEAEFELKSNQALNAASTDHGSIDWSRFDSIFKLKVSGGAEAEGGIFVQNFDHAVPAGGVGYVQADLDLPNTSLVKASLHLKIMAGGSNREGADSPISELRTALAGPLKRWDVYLARLQNKNIGVPVANLELVFPWLVKGFKFWAGIAPTENYAYGPYGFNSAAFRLKLSEWAASTLSHNLFDNSSGGNIYPLYIGLLFGFEYKPKFLDALDGLRIAAQIGSDGLPNDGVWLKNIQVGYESPTFFENSLPLAFSLTGYYSNLSPETPDEPQAKQPGAKDGFGVYGSVALGADQTVRLYAGYAQNSQTTVEAGKSFDAGYQSLNTGLGISFFDKQCNLAVGYAHHAFSDTSTDEATAENIVDTSFGCAAFIPGLVFSGGASIVGVDAKNQVDPSNPNGNKVVVNFGATFNYEKTLGL